MKQTRPLHRVVIKEEYVTLTGDHVSAILLSQIEYWTMRTHDFDRFLAEEKGRSSNEGNEINFSFMHGWIYKTAEDLSAETMMGLSANTIRTRLKKLVERGWIGERNNPAYRWDHTKQYRFNAAKVAMDLNTLGYPLEGWAITDFQGDDRQNPGNSCYDRTANFEDRISNSEDRSSAIAVRAENSEPRTFENFGTIPENTTEIKVKEQQQPDVVVIEKNILNEIVSYAASRGFSITAGLARSLLTKAGGIQQAKEAVDRAARSAGGTSPRNPAGFLMSAIHFDDGATFNKNKDVEREKRIVEKEEKYKDIYLS
jgi:hypothetical protein